MVRNNNMPLDLDQWNTLNRDGFHEFIISSGGQVQKEPITLYEKSYLNARDNNSSKGDNTLQSPLAPRTVVQEPATGVAVKPPLKKVSTAKQVIAATGRRPSAQGHEQEPRLAPIGGERSFIELNEVNEVVRPRRSHEGEPIRTSMVRMPSRHACKLPKLSVQGEPHEGDTIPTDALADDDPTSVIAAEENKRLHLKSTTELVDDKSNTISLGALTGKKGEWKNIPAVASSLSSKILTSLGNVSMRLGDHLKGSQLLSPSRRNQDLEDDDDTIIVTFHSEESQEAQGSEVNSDAAVTATAATAANTTFTDASSIVDVGTIIELPLVKVSIETLADDDPTFIGRVTKHSSSKNSKTRIAVDDLATVISTATKDIEMHRISAPMFNKVADDDPVSPVDSVTAPPITMVAISTLADDDPSTIAGTTKRSLSSTPRGKYTDDDSSIIVAAVTRSPNKVDTATLADDDLPITTCAVSAYTSPTSTWYSLPIG